MSRLGQLLALSLLTGVVAVSSALAAGSRPPLKITSTLDGKTVLPQRIHWTAFPHLPQSQVSKVDFLIDGRLGWVERLAPYTYGNDGNWLDTSFLTPGKHRFTVRVTTYSGRRATRTVTARVLAAPAPPSALAASWSRTVTADDVKKCTSTAGGGCPPTGSWQITITAKGWQMRDPQGGGGLFDVRYLPDGTLEMRPTIEYPPYPNANNGSMCADTDPLFIWTATVAGTTLTLHPVGQDPCGDRAAVLEGTWTRGG